VRRVGNAEALEHLLDRAECLCRLVAVIVVKALPADKARDVLIEWRLNVQQVNLHRRVVHELLDDMLHRELGITGAVDRDEYF
jgi:hypothetical protein